MKLAAEYLEEEESADDINIYSKGVREELVDDDEMSLIEAAFMDGYNEA